MAFKKINRKKDRDAFNLAEIGLQIARKHGGFGCATILYDESGAPFQYLYHTGGNKAVEMAIKRDLEIIKSN